MLHECVRLIMMVSGWYLLMLQDVVRLGCTNATCWFQAGMYKCYRVVSGWDIQMLQGGVRLGCTNAT